MTDRALRAVVVIVLLGSCVPAEKKESLGKRWDDNTVMGQLQEKGTLRVGTSADSPAAAGDGLGPYGDFTLDFATYLADTLGVGLETVDVPHDQLQTGIDSGDIDIAFPVHAITESGVRSQAFTDPLFVSHQRLLSPDGEPSTTLSDLAGQRVCASVDPIVGLDPATVDPTIDVVKEREAALCGVQLATGEVVAITAPDVVLVAVTEELIEICTQVDDCAATYPIVGDQLTTQGYGALLTTGADAWVDYVGLVLDKWKETGGWLASYQEHFGDALTAAPEPPDLTVEEAAALYPAP